MSVRCHSITAQAPNSLNAAALGIMSPKLKNMRYPNRQLRAICWIAAIAVLAHAWLPLLHARRPAQGFMTTLCSVVSPARQVFVPDNTAPTPAPSKDLQVRCPLCLAGAHFALMPPEDDRPRLHSGLEVVQTSNPSPIRFATEVWPDFHSRAPPAA